MALSSRSSNSACGLIEAQQVPGAKWFGWCIWSFVAEQKAHIPAPMSVESLRTSRMPWHAKAIASFFHNMSRFLRMIFVLSMGETENGLPRLVPLTTVFKLRMTPPSPQKRQVMNSHNHSRDPPSYVILGLPSRIHFLHPVHGGLLSGDR